MMDASQRNSGIQEPIDPRDNGGAVWHVSHEEYQLKILLTDKQVSEEIFSTKDFGELPNNDLRELHHKIFESMEIENGKAVELPISGMDETLWIYRQEDHLVLNFHGILETIGAVSRDTLQLDFVHENNFFSMVDINLIDAWDKGVDSELYAILEEGELEKLDTQRWLYIEWLIERTLKITRVQFEECGQGLATWDFAPEENFYQTDVFIQCQWLAEDEIQIEAIGPSHAKPPLSKSALDYLYKSGWAGPHQDHGDDSQNFTYRFRDPEFSLISKFIAITLQVCYQTRSTDLIVVRPTDVSNKLIDLPIISPHQDWCYPQGLLYPEDVELLWKFHQNGEPS